MLEINPARIKWLADFQGNIDLGRPEIETLRILPPCPDMYLFNVELMAWEMGLDSSELSLDVQYAINDGVFLHDHANRYKADVPTPFED